MSKIQESGAYLEQQTGEDLLLVEAYGDHGFRLRGRRVEGGVLVLENGFHPVSATLPTNIDVATVADLCGLAERPELLLVGTGQHMTLLPKTIREQFEEQKLPVELMDTGAAARTFNVLRMEGRRVAALLLPVE